MNCCQGDCNQGRAECDCDDAIWTPESLRDFLAWALVTLLGCAAVAACVWFALDNWPILVATLGGGYA